MRVNGSNLLSTMTKSDQMANGDNSSETDSSESIIETNNISSTTKSECFSNWTINSRPENGLMKLNKKAFTVLCEPEGENNENRELRQAPSTR